jgi:hypothetical protein
MMKTICLYENPYDSLISGYFNQEFPTLVNLNDKELLEVLSTLIVGTKEVRYGSMPSPEGFVKVRSIIRKSIENHFPIPILVGWGGVKSNFTSTLDIAEVSAINRLIQLQKCVKELYAPGLDINIRIEDTSAYQLFALEGDAGYIKSAVDTYTKNFITLLKIMNTSDFIHPKPESEMDYAYKFQGHADTSSEIIENYLLASQPFIEHAPETVFNLLSYKEMNSVGWKGIISFEQREHYLSAYRKMYNDWSEETMIKRLSYYFGGSLSRHQLEMIGNNPNWSDGFIQLSFVSPIKGLPEGYNYNYIYYRTLPMSQARTHMPAWRSKGYFKITGNTICAKLASWNDTELINSLIPAEFELTDGTDKVVINTYYLLES